MANEMRISPSHEEFELAIICALPLESNAVVGIFDTTWRNHNIPKQHNDNNRYTLGMIEDHYTVLTWMPGMGITNAATAATLTRTRFPEIKLTLVVGICGGAPQSTNKEDVILGDVIISTGIQELDFGRRFNNDFIPRRGFCPPDKLLKGFTNKLSQSLDRSLLQIHTSDILKELLKGEHFKESQYPGTAHDRLYESTYNHIHHNDAEECPICYYNLSYPHKPPTDCLKAFDLSCDEVGCSGKELVARHRLKKPEVESGIHEPLVHFGVFSSTNEVLKSAVIRDKHTKNKKIMAFETEAAGVWDKGPCLVIKAVCDYADSHKNNIFQNYAAAVAASCTKAFLRMKNQDDCRTRRVPPGTHKARSGEAFTTGDFPWL
jgi:nucleoside phosphorylase